MNCDSMLEKALDRELVTFEIDAKLARRLEQSNEQAAAFRDRFPIRHLMSLSQNEFRSPDGSSDDFCHWITDKTRDVAQTCSWDKIRLLGFGSGRGFDRSGGGSNGRRIPIRWDDIDFEDLVVRPLTRILEFNKMTDIPGLCRTDAFRRDFERAAAVFGRPLLLKIFLLYHPAAFINITRIEWLERTAVAFELRRGGDALETNWFVRRFYERKTKNGRSIPPLAFVEVLDKCLGFTARGEEEFRSYLLDVKGYPAVIVASYCRMLREMSRYAVGRRMSSCALQKVDSSDVLRKIGTAMWNDGEWLLRCRYDEKRYSHTFELLLEFLRFRSRTVSRVASRKHQKKVLCESRSEPADQSADVKARIKKVETTASLVATLCDIAKTHPSYSHYTTLSSLLAIVKSVEGRPALRLTRGDDPGMNDQLECRSCGEESLWRRTFIISFSSTAHENVAMWGLYCKPANEAVRLTFPGQSTVDWINDLRGGRFRIVAEVEDCLADKNTKMADVPVTHVDIFLGDVLYDADVLAQGMGKGRYQIGKTPLSKNDFKSMKNEMFHREDEMTGFVKSNDWFYEEEVRIVVRLKNTLRIKGIIDREQDMLKIRHLYLMMPDDFLSSVEYRLGPCVPERFREMFENKIINETHVNQVMISAYYGKLKLRA